MDQKIKIGLVEDQLLFRQGMKAILSSWKNLEVVFEASEGYTVINALKDAPHVPDVMLVDFSLPPQEKIRYNGNDVVAALSEYFPGVKVIILSVHDDENFIAQAIEHGAHGYLVKDCDPGEVHEAICAVYDKGTYINARTLKALQKNVVKKPRLDRVPHAGAQLTKREEEVLALICQQLTAEEIAERLFISVKTVNGHRTNLLEKTGSRNVAGLVVYAVKHGLVKV